MLPRTGIGSATGLSTDGMLGDFGGLAIVALDVDSVGDEGGWQIVASGVFPTWGAMYVDIGYGSTRVRCYSGVVGQGDECWSEDGDTLTFISPPLPVGEAYTVYIETVDASLAASLADALPVWHRSYTTNLYSLRAAHPPPRAVGAWDITQERWGVAATGDNDTLYAALLSALADTLYEVAGFLLTRVYENAAAGYAALKCEGLHRWPSSGRFALNGRALRYTGVDAVFVGGTPATEHYCRLTGVTEDDGASPTEVAVRQGDVLMYLGRDVTDIDLLYQGFFVESAEGADLDTLARNYGLARPRGLPDATFRALLRVLIYLDAQTVYAITKILDVLRGPGNYEVYERFPVPDENNRFYVRLAATVSASARGRAFMTAFELVASAGFTATASAEPAVVNGVWSSTDPFRAGTNYAEATFAVTATAPDRLVGAGVWTIADEGRGVRLSNGELWVVRSYLDPATVQVGGPVHTDGTLNTASPLRLGSTSSAFRPWMVGHTLTVLGTLNAGAYTIVEVVSEFAVIVSGASFVTETSATFMVTPAFAGTALTANVMRATIAGAVVTCPNVLPANVYLDYATTPSGQALAHGVDGTSQYPFYLFDDVFIVALIIDLVRAAGVEAVVYLE